MSVSAFRRRSNGLSFFLLPFPNSKNPKELLPKTDDTILATGTGCSYGEKKKEKKKHFVSAVPESLLGTCGPAQVIALSDPHDAQSWGATDRQHWEPTRHLCERVGVTGSPQSLQPSLL